MDLLSKILIFLKEVRLEIKKVNWPSREEVTRHTIIVVGVSFAVALYLGGIDFALSAILNKFILKQ